MLESGVSRKDRKKNRRVKYGEETLIVSGCNLWLRTIKLERHPFYLVFDMFDRPMTYENEERQKDNKGLFCLFFDSIHSQHHFKFIIQILFYMFFSWIDRMLLEDDGGNWKWRRMKEREKIIRINLIDSWWKNAYTCFPLDTYPGNSIHLQNVIHIHFQS